MLLAKPQNKAKSAIRGIVLLMLLISIEGCIMDSDQFHSRAPTETYHSAAAPDLIAQCIGRKQGSPPTITHNAAGVYRVEDTNTWGERFSQWEIMPDGSGSTIEYRKFHVGGSPARVKSCLGPNPDF